MFGYVVASMKELEKPLQERYKSVYCGICRQMRLRSSGASRLVLSYDMAFLALLHMSLYEPQERQGKNACFVHPLRPRPWVDNEYIRYAADMNVVLAYFNARDDWEDERRFASKWLMSALEEHCPRLRQQWPRQYEAVETCLAKLSSLEKEGCPNPDEPAAAFGQLMAELMVFREDMWAPTLRTMGDALGRFIYLTDAAMDYDQDEKKGCYNPFLASGGGRQPQLWKKYQLMAMGRCAEAFERLPLVQDKALLDNILYSGVWLHQGKKRKEGSA